MEAGKPRALVVDDDPVARRFMCETLGEVGYDVFPCADAPDAIVAFRDHAPFDVLVVDVLMPGVRGTHLVDMLCRVSADLRVLYVSAIVNAPRLAPGRRFLAKPFDADRLVRELGRLHET